MFDHLASTGSPIAFIFLSFCISNMLTVFHLNSLRTSHIFCLWPSGFICEGYGREYRERLLGRWGIVDVNDCCSCAKFLVIVSYVLKVSSFLWMGWANIPQFVVICVFSISGQ